MRKLHIKLQKKSTMIWTLLLSGIVFFFMAVYPSMANESMQQLVDGKMEALPDALLAIVGFEVIPDFTDIRVFYAYIMQYINIALSIFALSLGLSSFLKEEETGTIEFIYAQALSRKDFVLQKFFANLQLILFTVSMLVLSSGLSFIVFRAEEIKIWDLVIETLPIFASYYGLALIFLVLGSGLSLLLKSGSSASGLSMALVFVSYIMGIISSMVDFLQPLESISILHTFLPSSIYAGSFDFLSFLLWLSFALGSFLLGIYRFEKRDIQV